MNAIKLVAVKTLLLGVVLGAAALLSMPAHAGGYDGRGHHGGRHDGYAGDWDRYERRGEGRRYHREYGWYAPGQYYHDVGYDPRYDNHGGRVWCPERRTYVLAHQRYDDRERNHRGRGDRYGRHGRHDQRGYGGYRDRDRDYRGW